MPARAARVRPGARRKGPFSLFPKKQKWAFAGCARYLHKIHAHLNFFCGHKPQNTVMFAENYAKTKQDFGLQQRVTISYSNH
jgi:hypothetical protein